MRHPKAFIGSLASVFFCIGFASAAQDHNSSRSNKTSSVVAPDSGGGAVDMKVKEKANRTKSMTADGSQDSGAAGIAIGDPGVNGIAVDESGAPKPKPKGNATRKAFVLPHVLEKSGSINASAPCDPNTTDCGTTTSADHAINTKGTGTTGIADEPPAPQDHAINEKGLPGGSVKDDKKKGSK